MQFEGLVREVCSTVFGVLCHQHRAALIEIGGEEVLLCPRCIGLQLGFLFSFIVMALTSKGRVRATSKGVCSILATAIILLLVDWGFGRFFGFYEPTVFSRLATGLSCGSAAGILTISYRRSLVTRLKNPTRTLSTSSVLAVGCLSLCAGMSAVALSTWMLLSILLLLALAANALTVAHTLALLLWERLCWIKPIGGKPRWKKGARNDETECSILERHSLPVRDRSLLLRMHRIIASIGQNAGSGSGLIQR